MKERDYNDLRTAVNLLEEPGVGVRIVNLLGYPIEGIIGVLSRRMGEALANTVAKAVGKLSMPRCLTMHKSSHGNPHE